MHLRKWSPTYRRLNHAEGPKRKMATGLGQVNSHASAACRGERDRCLGGVPRPGATTPGRTRPRPASRRVKPAGWGVEQPDAVNPVGHQWLPHEDEAAGSRRGGGSRTERGCCTRGWDGSRSAAPLGYTSPISRASCRGRATAGIASSWPAGACEDVRDPDGVRVAHTRRDLGFAARPASARGLEWRGRSDLLFAKTSDRRRQGSSCSPLRARYP